VTKPLVLRDDALSFCALFKGYRHVVASMTKPLVFELMHFLFVHFSSALPEKVNWNAIIELFARRIFLTENEVQVLCVVEHRVSVTSELLK